MIQLIATLVLHLTITIHALHTSNGDVLLPVLVVAKGGGSETFPTVMEALAKADTYKGRVVIKVASGVHEEQVVITRPDITLIGDGIGKTVITGSLSVGRGGLETSKTATVSVDGQATGFMARGMTIRNTHVGSPAMAFQSFATNTVVYECSLEGFQDTVGVIEGKQFYKDCQIFGAVDFIFGFGTAVFQNCGLYLRKSSPVYITAQGKNSPEYTASGFVFHNCDLKAMPELEKDVEVYLGRPWRPYAKVVFIKSYLDGHVSPAGWAPWERSLSIPATVYFGENRNYGPGADVSRRTRWPGFHVLTNDGEASQFSVGKFLLGDGDWLTPLGVPFNATI